MTGRVRRWVAGPAAVAALIAASLSGATTALAAGSMTVTPSTGLAAGQVVQVTASGLPTSAEVAIVECTATATTSAGCNTTSAVLVATDATGAIPTTPFTVTAGAVGNGTCDTTTSDLTCVLAIGSLTGTTLAYAPITFAAPAAATSAPSLTVTPATGLTNGEKVTITGSGFTPSDSLYATECLATATSAADCNVSTATPITVNTDGTLPSTTFTVVTGTVGGATCGTSAADAASCVIMVANSSEGDRAAAPIAFAVPTPTTPSVTVSKNSGLKNGQTVTVTGSGFTPGDSVYAVECLKGATGQSSCDLTTATAITVNTDGTLPSTSFTVVTGAVASGTCGTTAANARNCVIAVANISGGDAGEAPIAFAVGAAKRYLRVAPALNLHNGQVVHVSGHGFTPRDHVYIVECRRGATGPTACDLRTLRQVVITPAGILRPTVFHVVTGRVGTGLCGTTAANARGCEISVANVHRGDAITEAISFRIAKAR
ncbi:MAG: neocarzinostatin apoprotein domain-containing protein [Acidimicrobiales bacterium]